ncbi:sel1 repeat family protein [Vibrio sp. SM6]|uniref:Sel1 repeat family protein n=2 Tax=Vibrio agarilyticus TaxID=2726741 RepID=A0A7X8TNE5_9VIBR|nr:sel1 repeat family protein [Vibrio agarilyticus]
MTVLAIGATSLALLMVLIWMVSLSLRKQRLENEKKARDAAYRSAVARAREQERQERLLKAESGDIPTLLYLAKEAERSSPREALHWYKQAALLDNVTAMYGILRIMEKMGEDKVLREQANFWRAAIAACNGDNDARFEVGQALIQGRGVERDAEKGTKLVEKTANEGNLEAMHYMGRWSNSHENLNSNNKEAFRWFTRAAKHNSAAAQIELGHCYLNGIGTRSSQLKACYWYERAAEQGHPEGMYYAGEAWRGCGKAGDALAYIWLFMAAHFGFNQARQARDAAASAIGVDVVVGLQAIAKPIQKKLELGSVNRHAIIKALNKLYKRPHYFPNQEENSAAKVAESAAPTLDEQHVESGLVNEPQAPTENVNLNVSNVDDSESVTVEFNQSEPSVNHDSSTNLNLDFSQPMR